MDRERIVQLLLDQDANVLGARQLLWPFMAGIQWNPADDRCVFGELIREDVDTGWSWKGELFSVQPSVPDDARLPSP